MNLFEYFGSIFIDDEGATKTLTGLGAVGEKLGTGLKKVGSTIATGMKVAAAGVAILATALTATATGLYKLAEGASDLVEAQNVVNETFDESGTEVNAWTSTMLEAAGISKTMATQFVGSMGAMLKSSGLSEDAAVDMSESLVQLAGDMASFYNLDHDEAWEKIRAGIAGETEPLKALGINMSVANLEAYALSQGITTAYSAMTQAEQTTLRYNYLMSVTADAQGDFARTSEGFANQTRLFTTMLGELGNVIGAKVLPFYTDLVKGANDAMSGLMTAVEAGDWDAAGQIVGDFLESLVNKLSDAVPVVITVGTKIVKSLLGGIIKNLPTIIPALSDGLVQILGALVNLIGEYGPTLATVAAEAFMSIVTALVGLAPTLLEAGAEMLLNIMQGIADNLPAFNAAVMTVIPTMVNILVTNLPLILRAGIQILTQLLEGFASAIPQLVTAVVELVPELIRELNVYLPTLITAGMDILLALVQGIIDMAPSLITTAVTLITTLVTGLSAALPELIPAAVQAILTIVMALVDNLPLLIDTAITLILALVDGIIAALPVIIENAPKIITALIDGVTVALPQLLDAALQIILALVGALIDNLPELIDAAWDILKALVDGLIAAVGAVWDFVPKFWEEIKNAIFSKDWGQIGKDIITGMATGITNAASGIATAAKKAAQKAIDAVKGLLGISSPSRVFRDEVGWQAGAGLAEGIEESGNLVDRAAEALGSGALDSANTALIDRVANASSAINQSAGTGVKATVSATTATQEAVQTQQPLTINIQNFYNNRDKDIQDFAEKFELYRRQQALAVGGTA